MKKFFLSLILITGMSVMGFSQETNLYSFFLNIVSEEFRFPLIGFVNIANGNHNSPQFGFVNVNTNDFTGLQMSFVNTVGGNFTGAQLGFINTALKEGKGLQLGFINTSVQKLKGMQIGFVNYADSIEDGIPIGFISIVRDGGYKAIEYSFTEFYPINLGLKLGVEKFYTTIIAAYNPSGEVALEHFAFGLGIGSIIPINNSFFFNPELNALSSFGDKKNIQLVSLVPYFGYKINKNFSVTAGPSVTWSHTDNDDEFQKPFFKIVDGVINEKNNITFGARIGVRFCF